MLTVGDICALVAIEPCPLDFIEDSFERVDPVNILLWVSLLEADGLLVAIELAPGETRFDLSDRWERH